MDKHSHTPIAPDAVALHAVDKEGSHDPVVQGEAQKIAELGTYALIGNFESSKQLQAEIHRLEQDPQHMKLVANELTNIRTVGKEKLPVDASVEKDKEGNVTSLKFASSKELETIAYGKEAQYGQCVAEKGVRPAVQIIDFNSAKNASEIEAKGGIYTDAEYAQLKVEEAKTKETENGQVEYLMDHARDSCKDLDTPLNAVGQMSGHHEVTVLTPAEQKTVADLKSAIESGDQAKVSELLKPYLGKDWQEFIRMADTDPTVRPYSYSLDGDKLATVWYPKKDQSGYNKFEANS